MAETTGKKLKVYVCHNYDGRRRAMVAAPTLEKAAKAMATTARHMREYGWRFGRGVEADLALGKPGTVFFASITAPEADWAPSAYPPLPQQDTPPCPIL